MKGGTLHLVHASDSHVRAGEHHERDLAALGAFVERVRAMHARGVALDAVVHTGDLVDDADAPEANGACSAAALAVLDELPVPWFLLNGNHDRRAFLTSGPRATGFGDVPATNGAGVAVRRLGPVQLVFADTVPERGGQADLEGVVEETTTAAVAARVDAHAGRSAVFLHHPPLAQEASWADPPAGGRELHAALAARASALHGVFVGHSHRALVHVRDGVVYATAPALAGQFLLWPGQREFERDRESVAGLHYITLGADGTTRIQHHAFVAGRAP